MTAGRRALAVASATVGTALLAGAFILVVRADAAPWAMLAWGVVALVAVATFLARFRASGCLRPWGWPFRSPWGRRSLCTRC